MASTFTPNLNLEKPARGDKVGSWDTAVNGNFDLIDSAVNVKIELTDLSVTVAAAGTPSLSYSNTTGAFTYTPPDLSGYISSGDNISALTNDAGYTTNAGTVTSVALSVPTGLTVSGSPITTSGTLNVSLDVGYSIPTTAKQGQWDSAYDNRITGLSLVGGTLTLTQLDGGTLTVNLDSRYLTSVAFADLTSTPTTLSGYGITDALQDGDTVSSLDINGGTIDGTVIGGSSAAAGTFTDITASGLTVDTDTLYVDSVNNRVGVGTTSPSQTLTIEASGGGANLLLNRTDSTTTGDLLLSDSNDTCFIGSLNAAKPVSFHVGFTEAARFDASRNFGIGTTSPTEKLHVIGNILASGDVTASSDERLKENIETLDGSKVLQMRGVSFTKDGQASSGVIAQELQKVAPELVHDSDEYLSVAYGNIVGYLIEAIKEQQRQIEQLKEAINGAS